MDNMLETFANIGAMILDALRTPGPEIGTSAL